MRPKALIVDDEPAIAQVVRSALGEAGYAVRHVEDADSAFALLKREAMDIILLDIELPGISGLRFLEILRKEPRTASVPVVLLTVLGGETNKVRGLDSGADDYLVKPFSAKELLARVRAILRRGRPLAGPGNILQSGCVSLDLDRKEATVKGRRVLLRPIEFDLLAVLMRRVGFVLTYETLSEGLSRGDRVMTSANLYVHAKSLRRRLGPAGRCVETVHGIGYKFVEF